MTALDVLAATAGEKARLVRTSGQWWLIDTGGELWRVLSWPDKPDGVFALGEASEGEAALMGDLLSSGRALVLTLPVTPEQRASAEELRPEWSGS